MARSAPSTASAGQQGDARPAEAAAGHPGAQRTGAAGRLDRGVELVAAHLVVVAQRGVRGVEQPPDLGQVAGAQRRDRRPHPRDLGDDVAGAAAQHVVGEARPGRRRGPPGSTSRSDDTPSSAAACSQADAALAVLAVVEGVLGAGVGDQQDVAGCRVVATRPCRHRMPRPRRRGRTAPARWRRCGSRAAGRGRPGRAAPPTGPCRRWARRRRRSRRARRPPRAAPGRRRRRAGPARTGRWPPPRRRTRAPPSSTARRPPAPRCRP